MGDHRVCSARPYHDDSMHSKANNEDFLTMKISSFKLPTSYCKVWLMGGMQETMKIVNIIKVSNCIIKNYYSTFIDILGHYKDNFSVESLLL